MTNSPTLTTRFRFPEDRMSFVYGHPGQPITTPPRTGLKLFLDEAATMAADIQTVLGVTIAYSTIYTGDDSLVPEFFGPPGFVNRLWARVVGGTAQTYPLMAQYSEQLGNLPTLVTGDGPPTDDIGAIGSFYIDQGISLDPNVLDDPQLYGPRTSSGWPSEGVPLRGASGPAGDTFTWIQSAPASEWQILHPLTYRPNVSIVDSAGEVCYADVSYPLGQTNRVLVRFGAPESGTAILT